MRIFRNVNSVLASNTYILCEDYESSIYVVDPGDSKPIIDWLNNFDKSIDGIILTHSHYDHIYGLNDLLQTFPKCKLFIEKNMLAGLSSVKLNTSIYHECPYVINIEFKKNIIEINEFNKYFLWKNFYFSIMHTPGHTPDSISIKLNHFLFCGDALIPGMKTYRVKNSNLYDIDKSIDKISTTLPSNTVLLPGHGEYCYLHDLKFVKKFIKAKTTLGFSELYFKLN